MIFTIVGWEKNVHGNAVKHYGVIAAEDRSKAMALLPAWKLWWARLSEVSLIVRPKITEFTELRLREEDVFDENGGSPMSNSVKKESK